VFRLFDEEATGYITFRNLKKICNDLGENLSGERHTHTHAETEDRDTQKETNLRADLSLSLSPSLLLSPPSQHRR
jgi:Ca2+-binding EF-hand superfamily protein